ncbi:uncharacterized protein LOC129918753 [Episyrphus balteatus]|uniref:uncharacterized protein LOC129918753 n=1 Tax=Episyrphus balteatus TaxID=286459 RepID=UPI0024855B47|nr:uncharacterized protein LOC129918753 [Episyrphus balteatus]
MFRSSLLIEEVRKKRSLWDCSYQQPLERGLRAKQWFEVGENLFTDWNQLNASQQNERVETIKRKWKNIRDYYIKGSKTWKGKKYVYSHLLSFLDEAPPSKRKRTMCNIGPICVFCKNNMPSLLHFTKRTLMMCRKISTIRNKNNLSQNGIIFPQQMDDFQLYHSRCYQRYITLPARYRNSPTNTIESESTSTIDFSSVQKDKMEIPLLTIQKTEKCDIQTEELKQDASLSGNEEDMPFQEILEVEQFLANLDDAPPTTAETSSSAQETATNRCLPIDSEHHDDEENDSLSFNKNRQENHHECLDADRCFLLSLLPEMKNMNDLQKITFKINVLNEMKSVMMRQDHNNFTIKEEQP